MPYTDVAALISLVLTAPTLLLAGAVVWNYAPRAVASFHRRHFTRLREVDLLVMGIVVGFAGSFLDNAYWAVAWSAEYLHMPSRDFLFENGAVANIPFRQSSGILAASLHLYPVYMMTREKSKLARHACAAALVLMFVLLIARGLML